ncbi:hypothetical protein FSP39_024145 [Pinctada imbricata]|uniref:Ig-like domain-containing protein n=1 Tax=Pinctada imbricata TaxID=66713 RepID=A0AA89BY03_PINIB|nr:hypothetical protein FSP39_024145 [Pinctada imbricata]
MGTRIRRDYFAETTQALVLLLLIKVVTLLDVCRISYSYTDITANCSGGALRHVPFQLQHNIKVLDLRNNNLKVLYENAFAKYDLLTILYLQNNSMTLLKNNTFAKLKDLKTLDLSNNKLTSAPTSAIRDLSSLLSLNLRGNRITRLENEAFANLASLKYLYLDGNYIEYIAPRAFYGLNFLQELYLQSNALTTLTAESFRPLTFRFKVLQLHDNRWTCDCHIGWLNSYLKNESREGLLQWKGSDFEPKCHGPSLVKGKLFSELNESQYLCEIRLYSSKDRKTVSYGKSVNLSCRYYSNPFVPPIWLKDSHVIKPDDQKYVMAYDKKSKTETLSVLQINDFSGVDTGNYQCYLRNDRGKRIVDYELMLLGEDPAMATYAVSEARENANPPNMRTIKIVLSVVGGILFLIVLTSLIIFAVVRCKRKRRKTLEERSITFKEHLKNNILNQNGGIMDSKTDIKSVGKETVEPNENDPLYDQVDRHRTEANNTYVSFKSEFTDQEEINPLYSTSNSKAKDSDESNCESTSPLLENFSPILSDSYDPLYESSVASSYYPSTRIKCNTLNSRYLPSDSSYDTYLSYTPYSTLSHTGQYSLPPHGIIPGAMPSKRSASATYLGPVPPKKPPRMFHSRDSMSLNSHGSESEGEHKLKLSLPRPKPGTVDQYGTAV